MLELSYQKWAIWKRTFNFVWDITSGKVENKKKDLAESELMEMWENDGVCLGQGFLINACIKSNNIGKNREEDWSKMEQWKKE